MKKTGDYCNDAILILMAAGVALLFATAKVQMYRHGHPRASLVTSLTHR